MEFIGEATAMGTSLELSARGVEWHMSIRRLDGRSDPRFLACSGKGVAAADVAQFIPNWRTLAWQRIADSMFSQSKSHTDDSAYQITVSGARGSSISQDDVVKGFKQFMACCD
ncbi:MAG: hypothetical protein JXQ75_05600 [Phycisphaerae bacterium]|nr:hypothetical protein [Phycisphaerae bacterium]